MNALKYLLYFAPLGVFAAMVVVFVMKLGDDPSVLPSAMLDKPVPQFSLPSLSGDMVSHDVFAIGEPILVNVFASWCQPCWAEHDVITALSERGIPIYGWAYKDASEDTARFLKRLGNPYTQVIMDEPGRTAIEFGVYGAPETYIIDGAGTIRHRHVGALTQADVDTQILPLLRRLREVG